MVEGGPRKAVVYRVRNNQWYKMTDLSEEDIVDEEQSEEDVVDELLERIDESVEQANQHHNNLDQMKGWAESESNNLAGRAQTLKQLGLLDEEQLREVVQKAQQIQSVSQRITGK